MFLFIQVMVILIAHYLKFPVTVGPQAFISDGADVKPLHFTCSIDGASEVLRLKPEVCAVFLGA